MLPQEDYHGYNQGSIRRCTVLDTHNFCRKKFYHTHHPTNHTPEPREMWAYLAQVSMPRHSTYQHYNIRVSPSHVFCPYRTSGHCMREIFLFNKECYLKYFHTAKEVTESFVKKPCVKVPHKRTICRWVERSQRTHSVPDKRKHRNGTFLTTENRLNIGTWTEASLRKFLDWLDV